MQYIPCNSALLAQETLFRPKKHLFCPKSPKKCVNHDKSYYRDKRAYATMHSKVHALLAVILNFNLTELSYLKDV